MEPDMDKAATEKSLQTLREGEIGFHVFELLLGARYQEGLEKQFPHLSEEALQLLPFDNGTCGRAYEAIAQELGLSRDGMKTFLLKARNGEVEVCVSDDGVLGFQWAGEPDIQRH
jgi:hypothetical protein